MGTRGAWGVVIDGVTKMAYNQYDSYPDGLGLDVLRWARGVDDLCREMARNVQLVDHTSAPTAEDIEALAEFTDLGVGDQSTADWYCLTRKTQGDPTATMRSGYMLSANDFPADSLFCEYAYVIDLDANVFEAYVGFQRSPHSAGRFAGMPPRSDTNGYHPVRLVASWPLDALPTDEAFCVMVEGGQEDEELGDPSRAALDARVQPIPPATGPVVEGEHVDPTPSAALRLVEAATA